MINRVLLNGLLLLLPFAVVNTGAKAAGSPSPDQVIGTWITVEKNLVVQVYKDGDTFKARIVWFKDSDDPSRPMDTRLDDKNPDKTLRTRKILGMNVLRNLSYRANTDSWEDGMIYDAKNGREWNSAAVIENDGTLKVTGYWHFKFIGKSIRFTRISATDRLLTSR